MKSAMLLLLDAILAWLTAASYLLAVSGYLSMRVSTAFLFITAGFTIILIVYISMQNQNRPRS
jgi:hypothetical protein